MSYMKDLILEYDVVYNRPSLEEINISLEEQSKSIWEKIKDFFTKIKNFFIRMFNWIKEKVLSFLNKFNKKKAITLSQAIKKINELDIADIRKISFDFFNGKQDNDDGTKSNVNSSAVEGMYNNNTGNIVDIKKLEDLVREYVKQYKEGHNAFKKALQSGNYEYFENIDLNIRASTHPTKVIAQANGFNDTDDVAKESLRSDFSKLTKEELLKYVEKLDSVIEDVEFFYLDKHSDFSRDIRDIEREIKKIRELDNTDSDTRKRFKALNEMLKLLFIVVKIINVPVSVILTYSRWIGKVTRDIFDVKYITTGWHTHDNELYHLSDDPDLAYLDADIMKPRTSQNSGWQFLPKRISFAPDVIACCYGVPGYFKIPGWAKGEGNEREEIELYLYKGVPDKSNTRYLKDGIVRHFVHEYEFTQEICVTTKIKIEKVGKVKIVYDGTKDWLDARKFLSWSKVD